MADDRRCEEVVTGSQELFQRFGVHPDAVTPQRLATVAYAVIEAMRESDRQKRAAASRGGRGKLS